DHGGRASALRPVRRARPAAGRRGLHLDDGRLLRDERSPGWLGARADDAVSWTPATTLAVASAGALSRPPPPPPHPRRYARGAGGLHTSGRGSPDRRAELVILVRLLELHGDQARQALVIDRLRRAPLLPWSLHVVVGLTRRLRDPLEEARVALGEAVDDVLGHRGRGARARRELGV